MLEIVRILSSSFNDTHWQLTPRSRKCPCLQLTISPVFVSARALLPVLWVPCDCYSDSLPSVLRHSLKKNFRVSLQLKADKMWKIQCLDNLFLSLIQLWTLSYDILQFVIHPVLSSLDCPTQRLLALRLLLLKLEGWRRREYVKIFFAKYNLSVSTVSILLSVQVSIQHFTLQTITPIVELVSPGGAEEWIIFEYVMKCIESVNLLWNNQLCTVLLLLLLHSRNLLCSDLLKMLYYSWQGNLMADINTWTGFRILPTPTTGAPMLGHNQARERLELIGSCLTTLTTPNQNILF